MLLLLLMLVMRWLVVVLVWVVLKLLLLVELLMLMMLLLLMLLLVLKVWYFVHVSVHLHHPFISPATTPAPPSPPTTFTAHCSHQPPAVRGLWERTDARSPPWPWWTFAFGFCWLPASFLGTVMGKKLRRGA